MRRLALGVTALALCAGCANSTQSTPPLTLPPPLVPAQLTGFELTPQPALDARFAAHTTDSIITSGKLFTIRSGAAVEGSFQTTVFAKGVSNQDPGVQKGILSALGGGGRGFTTVHLGLTRLLTAPSGDEVLYVWFPPQHNVMELFVMRSGFSGAGQLVRSLVADQLGYPVPLPPPEGAS